MENTDSLLGQKIRERRNEMGLTQAQLGERAGLTVQAINRIETGKRRPQTSSLDAILKALDWHEADLYAPQSPTLQDAISVLEAYKAAGPASRELVMAILLRDLSRIQDPKLLSLLEKLLSGL